MSLFAVTHTGQPGPLIKCTPSGKMLLKPLRAIVTVWVPQTSIRLMLPPQRSSAAGASSCMQFISSRPNFGSLKPDKSMFVRPLFFVCEKLCSPAVGTYSLLVFARRQLLTAINICSPLVFSLLAFVHRQFSTAVSVCLQLVYHLCAILLMFAHARVFVCN